MIETKMAPEVDIKTKTTKTLFESLALRAFVLLLARI
jgi:hypothetical protein